MQSSIPAHALIFAKILIDTMSDKMAVLCFICYVIFFIVIKVTYVIAEMYTEHKEFEGLYSNLYNQIIPN